MNTQVIDEDSVDSEALQAQIDLSMSFAQDLISSWMEPHKFPKSSRRQNLEQELTEYMKRPPRLGVGASIPEGVQSQTREVARLKGKLAGSKRPREEEDVTTLKTASDEESEGRATVIKKKARSDPFDVVHGKKKKKSKDPEVIAMPANVSSSPVVETKKKKDLAVPKTHSYPAPVSVGNKNIANHDSSDEIECSLTNPNEFEASPVRKANNKKESEITSTPPKTIHPQELQSISPSIEPSRKVLFHKVSPTKSPISHKSLPAELLKIPLLNLSGPPSDPESDGDPTTPSTSPKKKRKRRKKKKNHSLSLSLDTETHLTHQPTPSQ